MHIPRRDRVYSVLACFTTAMATFGIVVLADSKAMGQGNLPDCNSKQSKDLGICGTLTACHQLPDPCTGQCVLQSEKVDCSNPGTASQYCGTSLDVCTSTYECVPDELLTCHDGEPVLDSDGNPIHSYAQQGANSSCIDKSG